MPLVKHVPTKTVLHRDLIMGGPKTGKTPLAAAITQVYEPTAKWAYIAADPNSWDMPSIPEEWHKNIEVYRLMPEEGGTYDPLALAMQAATYPWNNPPDHPTHPGDPNIIGLIWDSMSHTAEEILQFIADQEFFSSATKGDKHVGIMEGLPGVPSDIGHMNIPVRGDYLAIKGIMERLVQCLFRQTMHVLVVTHVETTSDDRGAVGGPALVGKALIRDYPRHFSAVYRTEKVQVDGPDGDEPAILVHTEGDAFWIGGVRHRPGEKGAKNPIPTLQLGEDLTAFWRVTNHHFRGIPMPEKKEA